MWTFNSVYFLNTPLFASSVAGLSFSSQLLLLLVWFCEECVIVIPNTECWLGISPAGVLPGQQSNKNNKQTNRLSGNSIHESLSILSEVQVNQKDGCVSQTSLRVEQRDTSRLLVKAFELVSNVCLHVSERRTR